MRKVFIFVISFFLIISIAFISWGRLRARNIKKIYLKTAEVQDKDYPTTLALYKIKELLDKWSEGRIILDVYPSEQLGFEIDTIMQVQLGLIDITRVNVDSVVKIVNEFQVFSIPYLFRDKEHLWKVLNGEIGKKLLKSLEPYGLICLGFYDSGQHSFYNSMRSINNIDDIKDLRIRVSESKIIADFVEALGAVPVSMESDNIYSAIKSGAINGAENNECFYYSTGHYKIAKYYSYTEHCRAPDIILMSKKTWDSLLRTDQEYIINAVKESVPYQSELMKNKIKEAIDICKKSGCEFIEIDKSPFKEVMDKLFKAYSQDIMDLADKIKAVK